MNRDVLGWNTKTQSADGLCHSKKIGMPWQITDVTVRDERSPFPYCADPRNVRGSGAGNLVGVVGSNASIHANSKIRNSLTVRRLNLNRIGKTGAIAHILTPKLTPKI
jgi:hypothetical protein